MLIWIGKVFYNIAYKRERINYKEMQARIMSRNAKAMFGGKIVAEEIYQ